MNDQPIYRNVIVEVLFTWCRKQKKQTSQGIVKHNYIQLESPRINPFLASVTCSVIFKVKSFSNQPDHRENFPESVSHACFLLFHLRTAPRPQNPALRPSIRSCNPSCAPRASLLISNLIPSSQRPLSLSLSWKNKRAFPSRIPWIHRIDKRLKTHVKSNFKPDLETYRDLVMWNDKWMFRVWSNKTNRSYRIAEQLRERPLTTVAETI